MTLPTGTISLSQVNTELNRSSTAQISLGESAVRSLAGVPSGTISMNNLRGKSNFTLNPGPGSYSNSAQFSTSFRITSNQDVVWTWTRTSSTRTTATPASGSSSTQFNCSATHPVDTSSPTNVTYTVYGTYNGTQYGPWTIALEAFGNA